MAELSPGRGGKTAGESPRNVRAKRDQVLSRYANFKDAVKERRERLESARKFQQFRRDAQELESWVTEKLQLVSDEAYKDRTNLQVRIVQGACFIRSRGRGCCAGLYGSPHFPHISSSPIALSPPQRALCHTF